MTPIAAIVLTCLQILTWRGAADLPRGGSGQDEIRVESTELQVPKEGGVGFKTLDAGAAGIAYTNRLTEAQMAANRVLETGSGVAAGDFDGDGLNDVFFCSLSGDCRLYRNLGNLRFADVTAESGVNCRGRICRGAVFADIDGDNNLDLLVSAMGVGVLCFVNLGNGHFRDATREAGLTAPFGAMTMTLADVDGNGTLDIYVTNYRTNDVRDAGQVQLMSVNGRTVVPPALRTRFILVDGQVQEYGDPDFLFLNDGGGRFTPVSWIGGRFLDAKGAPLKQAPFDWGLTAAFHDLNSDGAPDLYVCNDYWTPDRIWINNGKGVFRALDPAAIRHTSASSMGIDFADIDGDGAVDIFVVDMLARKRAQRLREMPAYKGPAPEPGDVFDQPQINRNTLFHNRGDGSFEEIAEFSGLEGTDWSWQPLFLDVDLDGRPDLLISAGHTRNVQNLDANEEINRSKPVWQRQGDMVFIDGRLVPFQQAFTQERMRQLRRYPEHSAPIYAFRNLGQLRFEEATAAWGLAGRGIHHGIALADLDNDGDQDVVVNCLNAPPVLLINQALGRRVVLQLHGLPPNTEAVGARVVLRGGPVPVQQCEVLSGGKYLSGSERRLSFAAAGSGMRCEITWRDGKRNVIPGILPNRMYHVWEKGSRPLE